MSKPHRFCCAQPQSAAHELQVSLALHWPSSPCMSSLSPSAVFCSLLVLVGCGQGAMGPGGAGTVMYAVVTPHQIDLDPGNGPAGAGAAVSLQHVVAISNVDKYVDSATQTC